MYFFQSLRGKLLFAIITGITFCLIFYLFYVSPITTLNATETNLGSVMATQGQGSIPACIQCHGINGEGDYQNGVPRLAGLPSNYIFKQLEDFARNPLNTRVAVDPIARDYNKTPRIYVDLTVFTPGTRQSAEMNHIARQLSADDKRNLANYFSSLPFKAKPVANDFETLQRGEDLALRGKPEYGVPACISCHGKKLQGFAESFPPLAGQPPKYIVKQINDWQMGKRDNDHQALMRNVANQLTDGDKANIAAYVANLSYQVNMD